MPTNLYDAHRQWASRPPDERFENLESLQIFTENILKREFIPALDRAGLRRIRFHDLRHFYASILISQGENIKSFSPNSVIRRPKRLLIGMDI